MTCYPEDRLFEEVAFVAYHFHWDRETILGLPHRERHRWVEEISRINKKINESSGTAPAGGEAQRPRTQTGFVDHGGVISFRNPDHPGGRSF